MQLSGLQHFLFCRRQWALIHVEAQWQENFWTTDGTILHERTHNEALHEKRGRSCDRPQCAGLFAEARRVRSVRCAGASP